MSQGLDDRQFLQSAAHAAVALALSALLLLLCFSFTADDAKDGAEELPLNAGNLSPVQGDIRQDGDTLVFHQIAATGRAMAAANINFDASAYPFVTVATSNPNATSKLYLIWRTPRGNGTAFIEVPPDTDGDVTLDMSKVEHWTGPANGIGIYVEAPQPLQQPVKIHQITLRPAGTLALTDHTWDSWTRYRGWSGTSINFLRGYAGNPVIAPIHAAALWAGISLIVLLLYPLAGRKAKTPAYLLAIAIPWISLDLLWQSELSERVEFTEDVFGDKSMHERHLADADSPIYHYAQRLKQEVLPPEPARIFIIHDSEGHQYLRLKTQFYLLPHNIYNYGKLPNKNALQAGDYVLALQNIPSLELSGGQLRWQGETANSIAAEQIDADGLGQLFRILPESSPSRVSAP